MVEIIGYVSGFLLAVCGVPQLIKTVKFGHTKGLSKLFVWFWFLGEIGMLAYTVIKVGIFGPLLLNYGLNIFILVILLKYMYFPRRY